MGVYLTGLHFMWVYLKWLSICRDVAKYSCPESLRSILQVEFPLNYDGRTLKITFPSFKVLVTVGRENLICAVKNLPLFILL